MSRVEKLRSARTEMVAVRERILSVIAGKSDAELKRPPLDGGWSALEVLDHIRTAESQLGKALRKLQKGEPVRIPRLAYFYRLPMALAFSPIKIKAPKPVRPKPLAELVTKDVIDGLHTSRGALLAYVDEIGEEAFAKLMVPHFLLGRFTGVDWLRFIAGHEKRHLGQVERVVGATTATSA